MKLNYLYYILRIPLIYNLEVRSLCHRECISPPC